MRKGSGFGVQAGFFLNPVTLNPGFSEEERVKHQTHILYCRCANAAIIPEQTRRVISAALAGRAEATVVDDLCALAARRDPRLPELAAGGRLIVAACHARALRGLFRQAGVALDETKVVFLDMRQQSATQILETLNAEGTDAAPAPANSEPSARDSGAADDWAPWFPVIDYDRCRQCRQCLSFCLFGVYALAPDGRVVVENPRSCKNNCPACSRICPEVAIIFPKLPEAEAPLNGAEIGDESLLKERARIQVREILGGDIHAALAERQLEARKRRLRRPAAEQAERERAAHRH